MPHRHRGTGPVLGLVAVLGAALVAVALTVGPGGGPDDAPVARSQSTPTAARAAPTATMPPAATPTARSPMTAVGRVDLRYAFDDGVPALASGRIPLTARTAEGGALRTERRGSGLAVRFPPPCRTPSGGYCPRAILETYATLDTYPSRLLNPGRRSFRYGAAVRLSPAETGKGENVVQKGYSQGAGTSQFKLQIDGAAGRPSCVVVGVGSPRIHVASATGSVADGRWHLVECVRSGTVLQIEIDGREAGRTTLPAGLSIENGEPLRIGGKGTGPNNDQFHGAIDDVRVQIAAG